MLISEMVMKMNGMLREDSKNRPSMEGWLHSDQYGMSMGAMGVPYLSRSRLFSHSTRPGGSPATSAFISRYSSQWALASYPE